MHSQQEPQQEQAEGIPADDEAVREAERNLAAQEPQQEQAEGIPADDEAVREAERNLAAAQAASAEANLALGIQYWWLRDRTVDLVNLVAKHEAGSRRWGWLRGGWLKTTKYKHKLAATRHRFKLSRYLYMLHLKKAATTAEAEAAAEVA